MKNLLILLLCLSTIGLSACGQKGPLLPPPPKTSTLVDLVGS